MKRYIKKLIHQGNAPIHLIEIKEKIRFETQYISKQKKTVKLKTKELQLDPYYHSTI